MPTIQMVKTRHDKAATMTCSIINIEKHSIINLLRVNEEGDFRDGNRHDGDKNDDDSDRHGGDGNEHDSDGHGGGGSHSVPRSLRH
eukprot:1231355-Ditylum_brightwellii.AAC.1